LPCPLPKPPHKEKSPVARTPSPTSPSTYLKRPAPDDDEIFEAGPSSKKAKTNGGFPSPSKYSISSPSKKRRLEEDGLIMMESKDDKLDDDIIEIDD
jgi:ubiquitin-like 1-activating enzyme E1 B